MVLPDKDQQLHLIDEEAEAWTRQGPCRRWGGYRDWHFFPCTGLPLHWEFWGNQTETGQGSGLGKGPGNGEAVPRTRRQYSPISPQTHSPAAPSALGTGHLVLHIHPYPLGVSIPTRWKIQVSASDP